MQTILCVSSVFIGTLQINIMIMTMILQRWHSKFWFWLSKCHLHPWSLLALYDPSMQIRKRSSISVRVQPEREIQAATSIWKSLVTLEIQSLRTPRSLQECWAPSWLSQLAPSLKTSLVEAASESGCAWVVNPTKPDFLGQLCPASFGSASKDDKQLKSAT